MGIDLKLDLHGGDAFPPDGARSSRPSVHLVVDPLRQAPHRFAQTNRDFSKGLREHALGQIEFEAAQQREWTELLRVFENVPAAAEL